MMSQTAAVELGQDELGALFGIEPGKDDGISDPGLDVLVDGKTQVGEQGGLAFSR